MSATDTKEEVNEGYESCPEIDEDFFTKMEESGDYMKVLDSCGFDDEKEVKKEATEASSERRSSSKDLKSSRSRTESERSRDRDRRHEREKEKTNHDKERDRRRPTPERPRRSRFSPPGQRRSPPARPRYPPIRSDRRPPPQQHVNKRPSFYDEITAQFPDIHKDQQQNMANNQALPFQQGGYGMPHQMMQNRMPGMLINPMNPMVNPNFMPGPGIGPAPFMQPHQFHQNGPIPPLMNQFQQPFPNNIVPVNPLNNPMMAPGTYVPELQAIQPQPIPVPVQPPEPPKFAPASTSKPSVSAEQAAAAARRRTEEESQLAMKKDLQSLPLTDFLKKMAESKSRENSEAAKLDRVKEATSLLDELPKNERRLPFTFQISDKAISPARSDPKMKVRSPLVLSDNNPRFLSQAREDDCRDVMLGNPLRNISGELFDFARHLGLDLVDISEKVKAAAGPVAATESKPLMHSHARPREFPPDISNISIDLTARCSHQAVQTMFKACDECELRYRRKFTSKGTQCMMTVPEPMKEEPGSFKASFDVATMNTISETQRVALAKFCQAFNLYSDSFGAATELIARVPKTEKRAPPAVLEDLAAYTNPENPHQDNFVSFSPVRDSPRSSPFTGELRESLRRSESRSRSRFNPSPYDSRDLERSTGFSNRRSASRSPVRPHFGRDPQHMPRRSRSFSESPTQNSRNGRSSYENNEYDRGSYRSPAHASRSRSPAGFRSRSSRDSHQGRFAFDQSPRRRPISERLGNKIPSPMDDDMDPRSSRHYTEMRPYHIPSPRVDRRPSPPVERSLPAYRENSFKREYPSRGHERPRSRSRSRSHGRGPGYRQPPASRPGRF